MAGITGVALTTSEVKAITNNIKTISSDVDEIMRDFNNTMTTLTGQAEGGLIDKTKTATTQLFDAVGNLSKCILRIGLKIGDYLKMMLTQDSNLADKLRNEIER